MGYLDFVVRLIWPRDEIEANNPRGETIFQEAMRCMSSMVEKPDGNVYSFETTAEFLEARFIALEDDFDRFYRGTLLMRPVYEPSYLTGPRAQEVLSSVSRKHDPQQIAALAMQMMLQHQGAAPPAPVAPPLPPVHKPKRPRKPRAPPAAAPAALPAAAAALGPAVAAMVAPPAIPPVAPPPAPPAAPLAPAVNLFGITGGAPHVGRATGQEMAAWSAANLDVNGEKQCFNFWRRGQCVRGSTCVFSHQQ